jgi:hypothetical protein
MINSKKMVSYTELFKAMEILPSILSINISFYFIFEKQTLFTQNLEVHNNDIRPANNFHLHITTITKYQNTAHYAGIKISIIFLHM